MPYGFQVADDGRTLARHDNEQATLTLLRQLRANGHTLAGIAAALNQRGVRTRRNGPWSHQFVCQLLTRHPTGTGAFQWAMTPCLSPTRS